jgi:hypothetical protein
MARCGSGRWWMGSQAESSDKALEKKGLIAFKERYGSCMVDKEVECLQAWGRPSTSLDKTSGGVATSKQ